jgi:hypothetical protein
MQHILILSGSKDDHREFFAVGTRVCNLPYAVFRQPDLPKPNEDIHHVGEVGMMIASDLLSAQGIERIFMRNESIDVTKAPNSSWRDLQPLVLDVLKKHLGQIEVVRDYDALTRTAAMEVSAA